MANLDKLRFVWLVRLFLPWLVCRAWQMCMWARSSRKGQTRVLTWGESCCTRSSKNKHRHTMRAEPMTFFFFFFFFFFYNMVKFILFPASRGPFSFVFAELTDGTKRDLCHGSKLSLIQPPSMVVDGGFRNASLSSAEAPVSKHQRKKLERLAGALERENGSAGNDFFLSPSQRSPHALIFPLPSLRAPRVYFSQGPRL